MASQKRVDIPLFRTSKDAISPKRELLQYLPFGRYCVCTHRWKQKQNKKYQIDFQKSLSLPKISDMEVKEPLFEYVSAKYQARIECGESKQLLQTMESDKFDLIVTSPPYNVGKSYEVKQSIETYLDTQKEIIKELVRVLSTNGSICWQVGNYVDKGEIFPLDIYYYHIFKELGLKLRNRIIWHFGHGLHASNRFSGRYETILWFTKTDDYIFNLDDVRVPSKYPGKLHFKGDKKGMPSGNPLGKNPSDIWEIVVQDWETLMWNIPNVKSNHPEKTVHPCQFPVELVERCVLALTEPGSWVLDPFAGVGSTLIASLKNDRNAIGIEKESDYCEITQQRIAELREGTLKFRPINKPIHIPSANDKVAKIPNQWKQSNELESTNTLFDL